jgi:hypothetical protein
MSQMERMDGREVKEEDREDDEEMMQGGGVDAKETKQEGPDDDEQQGKGDGDHETMTSGLSDNDVDATSAHESEEEGAAETKPADSDNTVNDMEKPDAKEALNEATVSHSVSPSD